jgi:hypothetical protein
MTYLDSLLTALSVVQWLALFRLNRRLAVQKHAFHDLSGRHQASMADLRSLRAVTEDHVGQAFVRIFSVVQNLPELVTDASLIDGVINDGLWAAMRHMKHALLATPGGDAYLMPCWLQREIQSAEAHRPGAQK